MDLNAVLDDVGARLKAVPGLEGRVYDYEPDSVSPPAAIVLLPDRMRFDLTYGRGADSIELPVLLIESRVDDRSRRSRIASWCSGSGSSSIKAALEREPFAVFDSLQVKEITFDPYEIGGVVYVGALFLLDIVGSGNG